MSRYAQTYVKGVGSVSRALRWMSRQVDGAMVDVDRFYHDLRQGEASATITNFTAAAVLLPKAPEGFVAIVNGFINGAWTTGSSLDAWLSLDIGSRQIATAQALVVASAGSFCSHLAATFTPQEPTTVRLRMASASGRTECDILNAGLEAFFVRE